MSIIQVVARQEQQIQQQESGSGPIATPSKQSRRNSSDKIENDFSSKRKSKKVLDSRTTKSVQDKKLIICLISFGFFTFLIGIVLMAIYWIYEDDYFAPFIILGPILCVLGIAVVLASVEICLCARRNGRRKITDDDAGNRGRHNGEQQIHPELIVSNWSQQQTQAAPGDIRPSSSYRGAANHQEVQDVEENDDDPQEVLALQMMKAMVEEEEEEEGIPSDIFDESLRYSRIDRPTLLIVRSSPTSQRRQARGAFVDEEERIANLFTPRKKKK